MKGNSKKGCAECIKARLEGMNAPLEQIASAKEGPLLLYQCKNCECYWVESLREAHPVAHEEALKIFQRLF